MTKAKQKKLLTQLLTGPHVKEIVKEWALTIKKHHEPSLFANLYLELMRDPKNDDLRRDTSAFLIVVDNRDWKEILSILRPVTDKATLKILKSKEADSFFQAWKFMVKAQVADYWRQFLKQQKPKKGRKAV